MGIFKKWKQDVWFTDRAESEPDISVVKQVTKEPKPKKTPKPKKEPMEPKSIPTLKPTWKDYLLRDNKVRCFYVLSLCVIFGLIAPSVISYYLQTYQADLGNCNPPSIYKLECLSGKANGVVDRASCEAAGCCYDEGSAPKCFHRNPTRYSYTVSSSSHTAANNKIVVNLQPAKRSRDYFNSRLPNAKVVVRAINADHVVVQLLAADQSEDSFRLLTEDLETPLEQTKFRVSVAEQTGRSFGITVTRADTGAVLLDTSWGPLVVSNNYVEMSTTVSSRYVYGLGLERKTSFVRNFNYNKIGLHSRPGADGFHPFFMAVEPQDGSVYGVFWDNPHPLEVQFSPAPIVSFRAMGGSGVIHIFAGPTPADVSKQFTAAIVGPISMPPYWSLGFHLCRESDDPFVFENTFNQFLTAPIGFDSDCIDARLSGAGSGQVDWAKFPDAQQQRTMLWNQYKNFIFTQPPHVVEQGAVDNHPDWTWIVAGSAAEGEPVVNGTRSGAAVIYPSYPGLGDPPQWGYVDAKGLFQPEPEGFYLADNWPADDRQTNCTMSPKWNFVPERLQNGVLTAGTLCVDYWHPNFQLYHVAVHNHYGVQQLKAVAQGDGRTLYMTRSSALGNIGRAGYQGDEAVSANWLNMKSSLIQVLEMGLFGVALSGGPICGSTNSSTIIDNLSLLDEEQLCVRWYQMGLFLPFARSYTKLDQRARSPVDWSPTAQRILAHYIQERYRLLPYYYTLFHHANTEGTPVVRPLFYSFPKDNQTYNISEQFMIGDSLMAAPVFVQELEESNVQLRVYFPAGTWYDYFTGDLIAASRDGTNAVVPTSLYGINLFTRNGTVHVTQEPGLSAEWSRKNGYTITASFPIAVTASGWLYVDDGYTTDPSAHDRVRFTFSNTTFTMELVDDGFFVTDEVSTVVQRIVINGIDLKRDQVPDDAVYDPQLRRLRVDGLQFDWKAQSYFTYTFVIQ